MGGAQTLKANRYQAKLRKKLKIILFYSAKCTEGMYKRSRIFSIFVLSWRKGGQCLRKEGEGNAVVAEKHTRDIACHYAHTSSLDHNYHHDSHHCHCYRWCHPWILLAFKHFLTKFLCTNKQKLFHYTIVPILTVDLDEQISSEGILFPARSTSFAQLVEGNNSGFNKLICVHDLVS